MHTPRITREDVRELLGRSAPGGVLSVYIGLPASARHDPARWVAVARNGLRDLVQRHGGVPPVARVAEVAQREIEALPVEARRQSLVYFRSLDPEWRFHRSLHPCVSDHFAFASSPQVAGLVSLLDETPLLGVAVASQDRARLCAFRAGMIEEAEEIRPEDDDVSPTADGLAKSAFPPNRAEDRIRRGWSRIAHRIGRAVDQHRWQKLLLVGTPPAVTSIRDALPVSCRLLLIDTVERNMINAPLAELGDVAEQAMHDWKRRDEVAEVERVLDEARSGGRGAAGMEICLDRLYQGNIETLFVKSDLAAEGFQDETGRLYARAPVVPAGSPVRPQPRLVELMVQRALECGARVVPLEGESARRLGLMGGVAARLRWREGALSA